MDSLTLDKIFVLDNFSFVQNKKYFVRADGRGIRGKSASKKYNVVMLKKFVAKSDTLEKTKHGISVATNHYMKNSLNSEQIS